MAIRSHQPVHEQPDAAASGNGRSDAAFGEELGRRLRQGRAKRGMTRRQLAQDSGTSERYLAQIEAGAGNPSIVVMHAIAEALDTPIAELLPMARGRSDVYARIVDMLDQVPPDELPAIADLIEKHSGQASSADRAQRIALVGLRGAGKSTLGARLAEKLDCPFVELNRMIEQEYGASLPMLIEMSGVATFRRYERACLERVDRRTSSVWSSRPRAVSCPAPKPIRCCCAAPTRSGSARARRTT